MREHIARGMFILLYAVGALNIYRVISLFVVNTERISTILKSPQKTNKGKNLYTNYFVFDLDGECNFIKTKHYSD